MIANHQGVNVEFTRFERASSKTGCIQLEVLLQIANNNKMTHSYPRTVLDARFDKSNIVTSTKLMS